MFVNVRFNARIHLPFLYLVLLQSPNLKNNGAAWLSMVWRGSVWCGVTQLVTRRLAVRQARVRFSARHHRKAFPTELTSDEEMERGPGQWRWIIVLYECD